MKKDKIFILVFCAMIFLPAVFLDTKSEVSKAEKRNMAKLPHLIENGKISGKFFEGSYYESYFNDRFGGREEFARAESFIESKLVAFPFSDRAIKGKNGWLFFIDKNDGDNAQDFLKRNLLDERKAAIFRENVRKTADFCRKNKIKFLFLIGPNKHSVYPENYPLDERPDGITRADQISRIFKEMDIACVFPRDYLISCKTKDSLPLYYETDTHWNPLGAFRAFEKLKIEIEKMFPDTVFPEIKYEIKSQTDYTVRDLMPMLRIGKMKSTNVTLFPAGKTGGTAENSDFYKYLKNEGIKGVHTVSAGKSLPRALIYRDSFFSSLEPFVSPLFSEAEYIWKRFGKEDESYVNEYKPDIIIFEAVERAAPSIY